MVGPHANKAELFSQSLNYQLLNQQCSVSGKTAKAGNASSISSYDSSYNYSNNYNNVII